MADPFTIIGTTAAVIDLAKLSWKIVNTAYRYCESETGALAEDEDLEGATKAMNGILEKLSCPEAGADGFVELLNRCRAVGDEIISLLNKTKITKDSTVLSSIKASFRKVWTKDKLDTLRTELDHIMIQLGVYLQMITRSDTGSKLDTLLEAAKLEGKELAAHKHLLDSLKDGQRVQLNALNDLHRIFMLPDQVTERISQQRILKALNFEDIDSRFDKVFSAVDSFKWCLSESELPASHPDLKISYRDWLEGGRGVFHISGKMGSGKSTLMKYIVRQRETTRLLEKWAGEKRNLVVAHFFFWKPGTQLQKSLEGLLRSLVHTLLSKLPHLIPAAFPRHWEPHLALPWLPRPDLVLHHEEVQEAFQHLISGSNGLGDLRFCFFIDGLDEFQDPNPMENHRLLAKYLQSWTTKHQESVKLCISSREYDPFMDIFTPEQRFRLHLLTAGDMSKTAIKFLEQHDQFMSWEVSSRHELVEEIVSRASGVYLWLTCALQDLWTALDQKQDLEYLKARLDTLPDDMDEFFHQIVQSISKPDRKEAWAVFALATATKDFANEGRPSLLHYSFLGHLVKRAGFWPNRDALVRDLQKLNAKKMADSFRLRLKGLCKGLIETAGDKPDHGGDVYGNSISLTFTHRSIPEHFEENLRAGSEIRDFFDCFDSQTKYIQCAIMELKMASSSAQPDPARACDRLASLVRWSQETHKPHHLEQLGFLEDILLECQNEQVPTKEPNWAIFQNYNDYNQWYRWDWSPASGGSGREAVSFLSLACRLDFTAFVDWFLANKPDCCRGDRTRTELLFAVLTRYPPFPTATLQLLLRHGFDPNLSYESRNEGLSPWQLFILRALIMTTEVSAPRREVLTMVAKFLGSDVSPDFTFTVTGYHHDHEEGNDYDVEVRHGNTSFEVAYGTSFEILLDRLADNLGYRVKGYPMNLKICLIFFAMICGDICYAGDLLETINEKMGEQENISSDEEVNKHGSDSAATPNLSQKNEQEGRDAATNKSPKVSEDEMQEGREIVATAKGPDVSNENEKHGNKATGTVLQDPGVREDAVHKGRVDPKSGKILHLVLAILAAFIALAIAMFISYR